MIKLTTEHIRRIQTALMTENDNIEESINEGIIDEKDLKYAKRDIKTNKQIVAWLEQATSVILETIHTCRYDNN